MRKQLALALLVAALTALSAGPLYADDTEPSDPPPAEVTEEPNENEDTIEGIQLQGGGLDGLLFNHNITLVEDR